MRLVRLGALLLAGPAVAQSADTTCTQVGMFTNCNTQYNSPPPPPDFSGFAALGRALAERRARKAEERRAAEAGAFNQQIAALVQNGQCAEANNAAIQAGRYDVVNAVSQVCKEQKPSPISTPANGAPVSSLPICDQMPRPYPCKPG